MALQAPLINGRRYDFASVETAVNGLPVLGRTITALDYSDSVQRGIVRAGSPLPIGYTRGEYSAEGSIEMPREEYPLFLSAITANSPLGIYEVSFELTVAYAELGQALQVDNLNGVRLNGAAQTLQRGPEGLVVRCPLLIHLVVWNGKLPLSPDVIVR